MTNLKSIGIMSGTSMDGIDAALIDSDGMFFVHQLATSSLKYKHEFKILLKLSEFVVNKCLGNMIDAENKFIEIAKDYPGFVQIKDSLSSYLYNEVRERIYLKDIIKHSTMLHIKIINNLINSTNFTLKDINLVGYHGQTLYHNPKIGISIQVGDAEYMLKELGITVIDDFRSNDIKNGGCGAPLAPIYHQALAVRDNAYPVVVVNCGGISNITYINGKDEDHLIGFDTGPGNVLIDRYVRIKTNNQETYDKDGKYGSQGKVHEEILDLLYRNSVIVDEKNYFETKPPKSLDSGNFKLISELDNLSLEDGCATLEAFTSKTIADSVKFFGTNEVPKTWILAGGGWNNPVIVSKLKEYLGSDINILKASEISWDTEYMEAELFAYLAIRSYYNLPITYPSTTNVDSPCVGGKMHYPTIDDL